jgi:F-type H+-transporting ATPase subunit beta
LFYAHGYPLKDISAFLEVPVSTLKKRLFDARKHLKERLQRVVRERETHDKFGPGHGEHFLAHIQLAIAVRVGDMSKVKTMLDQAPFLTNTHQVMQKARFAVLSGHSIILHRRKERIFSMTNTALLAGRALLGRIINSRGEPIDEKGPISTGDVEASQQETFHTTNGTHQTYQQGVYETGIKAIDLLAPIPRGGLVGIYGGIGVGKFTLLEEMIFTLAQRSHGYTICLSIYEQSYVTTSFIEMVQESHLQDQMVLLFEPVQENGTTLYTQLLQAGMTIAGQLRTQGHEILLIIDAALANQFEALDIDELRQFAREKDVLTLLLRGMTEDVTREPDHFDSTIVLSSPLAHLSLWPAIDRQQTNSVLFESNLISEEHKQVMRKVKQILHSGDEWLGRASAPLSPEDRQTIERARRINFFFTQPFTMAEQFMGKPGEYLTINQTVADFKALVEGHYDDVPLHAFQFIGQVKQAHLKS